jgi:hypothetical protein
MAEVVLVGRLRKDLLGALKAGDRRAVAALRQALAAVGNAEAPPDPAAEVGRLPVEPVVGRLVEHRRLELTDADVQRIVRAEIAEHEQAAARYAELGRGDAAADRAAEADALRRYVA